MKKIIVAAVLFTWAGTLYGAYAWGSNRGPSESVIAAAAAAENRTTLCSMSRQLYEDANSALDYPQTFGLVSMSLRALGREHPDTAWGTEALYQINIQIAALNSIDEHCTSED